MGKPLHWFSLLAAYIAPPNTMKATHHGGDLQKSSCSVPLRLWSNVYGVFRNRVLSSSSEKKTTKRKLPMLSTGVFVRESIILRESTITLCRITPFENMHTYIIKCIFK